MTKRTKITQIDRLAKLEVGQSTTRKTDNVNRYNSAMYRASQKYGFKFSRKTTATGVRITRVA